MRRLWLHRILVCLVLGLITTVVLSWSAALAGVAERHDGFGTVGARDAAWRLTRYRTVGLTRLVSLSVFGDLVSRLRERDESHRQSPQGEVWSAVIEPLTSADVPAWSRASTPPEPALEGSAHVVVWEDAAGWPCRALATTICVQSIRYRTLSEREPRYSIAGNELRWTDESGEDRLVLLEPGDGVRNGVPVEIERHADGRVAGARVLPLRPVWPGFAIDAALFSALWLTVLAATAGARAAVRRRLGCCPRCAYDLRNHDAPRCPECGWAAPRRPRAG